jgi:hypothetical protein
MRRSCLRSLLRALLLFCDVSFWGGDDGLWYLRLEEGSVDVANTFYSVCLCVFYYEFNEAQFISRSFLSWYSRSLHKPKILPLFYQYIFASRDERLLSVHAGASSHLAQCTNFALKD